MSALSFLKDSVFAEEHSLKKGFGQSLDPRLKAISFAMLFITILFLKRVELLIFLYLICLILAILSKIDLGYFLKRTWIFIPIFSLFIAIPALFNIFSPGEAIATLNLLYFQLIITREGLQSVILFVLRVLVSVSYVVILSLTTRHTVLLRVLRIFKIPDVFVMTLGMCYRYIYLFVEIIENTYLSIKSRTGSAVHYKKGQKIVAWNIGCLWQRSYGLSSEIYNAMLSRGYSGEAKVLDDFKIATRDFLWFILVASLCIFTLLINY
ncbi:MAG: cobalt ECF transporter T component CbiQ [Candidatus Firestonebacteria bacterium]